MATSQNGWSASANRAAVHVEPLNFKGETFPGGVRHQDGVATVFYHLVKFLDAKVERIHPGWCWGHSYRAVTAGRDLSNHASGTAIDFNAPAHPYGVRGTWSRRQKRRVHKYLRDTLDGAVRWGEDYSGTKDGMHFEVDADAAKVRRVAEKLRGDRHPRRVPFIKRPQAWDGVVHLSRLAMGKHNSDTAELQRVLNAWYGTGLETDGIYGPKTDAAFEAAKDRTGGDRREALQRLGFEVRT